MGTPDRLPSLLNVHPWYGQRNDVVLPFSALQSRLPRWVHRLASTRTTPSLPRTTTTGSAAMRLVT